MKSGNKSMEGQIDIFDAMNRAAEAVERMVEQEHRAKKSKVSETLPKATERSEEESMQPSKVGKAGTEGKKEKRMKGEKLHASMQRTFINTSDDDFATVAYIDYNKIYWKDWNAPASLRCFQTARESVDFYMEKLNEFRESPFASPTTEHEPFSDLVQVTADLYAEEG